jgi:hypothetical protein
VEPDREVCRYSIKPYTASGCEIALGRHIDALEASITVLRGFIALQVSSSRGVTTLFWTFCFFFLLRKHAVF